MNAEEQLRTLASSGEPPADEPPLLDLVGTTRLRAPEETLEELRPLLPELGITRIANVTGLDDVGIPVSMCVRPGARSLSVSQGKGVTQLLADVSAVMESIESYHSENVRQPDLVGHYSDLKAAGYNVVSPTAFVPGPIRWSQSLEEKEMAWVTATNLSDGRACYVPRRIVCLDLTRESGPHDGTFSISSNGLASGNSVFEATCHGLYEVIERDARASWEASTPQEIAATEVDLKTIHGHCSVLLDRYRSAGIQVRVWDLTGALAIPVFVCFIRGKRLRGQRTFGGAGCHMSREIALSRALTEAAQSRLTLICGTRDDCFPHLYAGARDTVATAPSDRSGGGRRFGDGANLDAAKSCALSVRQITTRLIDAGFEDVLVVNLGKSHLQVPVVHVLIPGMEFRGG